ncbi:MAG: glycosyltransferase family 2 protein [Anaerolineales bacterium]|nr:glycosyltransferase family 2 protein [Anaerolineales bacterium]
MSQLDSPRVILIIVNWNGRAYLEPCLSAVFRQDFQDFAVIVVDNGSTDGSCEFIRVTFPQVRLIENHENLGFAAANNQAIQASQSALIATLNTDTVVAPGWLGALVQAMERDPRVGMCASKMLLASATGTIDAAGIAVDRAGIASNVRHGEPDSPEANVPSAVFGACAGAALYRRAMLDEIGLFDPDFFMYMEDVDLAWRAQWADWRAVYVPEAVVVHVHSGTAVEGSPLKNRLLGRNREWVLLKNYPFPPVIWYAPVILLYDLMAVGYAMLAKRQLASLHGRLQAIGQLRKMLVRRSQRVMRISWREMMRRLQPIEGPLAVARRYRRP